MNTIGLVVVRPIVATAERCVNKEYLATHRYTTAAIAATVQAQHGS